MSQRDVKRVEVVMEQHGTGKVVVDGVEVTDIVSVEVYCAPNKMNTVIITRTEICNAEQVSFIGPGVVQS